jgi:DNA repair protein RecO (recombination protein O)
MEETEGIVLKTIDFRDSERIITLFTKELGLISLIVKGVSPSSLPKLAVTTPFCQAQFFFTRGNSDLFRYRDSTVLQEHHNLRAHFSFLEAAGVMAKALLQTQLPGKPASLLYALFDRYLKQIPTFTQPLPLTISFLLKLLHLEGILSLSQLPEEFSTDEKELILSLVESRSFKKLGELPLTLGFAQKIYEHFIHSIRH